jgi:CTP:molybdopterin cytidylyltransferase MocA
VECILRVSGRRFDVDAFLQRSTLTPCTVWRKGDPRRAGRKTPAHSDSGFNVAVPGSSDQSLERQARAALRFLKRNHGTLVLLRDQPGVEHRTLDFGMAQRSGVAQFDHFPAELVSAAGALGMALELSRYEVDDAGQPDSAVPTVPSRPR